MKCVTIDVKPVQYRVQLKHPSSHSTSLFLVTSTKEGKNRQNFLIFCFNPVTPLQNFQVIPSTSPKLLSVHEPRPPKKYLLFDQNWSCDNFFHRNARITKVWTRDHIYNLIWLTWLNFVGVIGKNYDVITFISIYCYFKETWGPKLCWHHQTCNHDDQNKNNI